MEYFSGICSFFININHQSIKLILKNGKSMASLVIISHSLLSILLFLFSISIKSLQYNIDNSFMEPYTPTSFSPATNPASSPSQDTFLRHMLMYIALLLLVELVFVFAVVAISHISTVAAILISAASYTGKSISFHDLFSMIAKRWKRPWTTGLRGSRTQPARYSVLVVSLATILCVIYPNSLTYLISILLGVIAAIFFMYSSVAWILAMVVSVVEEGCFGKEALERGEELAKGHRTHGFLLNIFFNSVVLVPFLGCWWIFGDKVLLDFPNFLVIVNILSLVKMLATVEYTVLYFECKKYHEEEEIQVLGEDLQYTKVPSVDSV